MIPKLRILFMCWLFISIMIQLLLAQISPLSENIFPMKQKITSTEYKIHKPKHLEKIPPSLYTKTDWKKIIDSTWGAGLSTTEHLTIFDKAWNDIDQRYGAFMNISINIDSLRDLYRPEIEAGVSRGRFAAILNHLAFALKDAHTLIEHMPVNVFTDIQPGIPLFVTGACVDISRFGAGLTPLPDSTLLVYKALPNHTLGLQPGDIVLGYDGVPWKRLYKQLLDAQLPLRNTQMGSNDESAIHILLQSAGLNWHLFDTIDILKYDSGDTIHLPTALLLNQSGNIWGNEQLPIPGVAFPDVYNNDFVSWGIVEGTTIGYIYVWSWFPDSDVSAQFYHAVYNIMYNYETTGLIIDFRVNYGGDMRVANAGYSLLFNETLQKIAFDNRGDPGNHIDMVPSTTHPTYLWTIKGDPESFYDKPIAVLTGPNAFSNGDWESVRMQFHPMVRTFGKSTNGAFTINERQNLGNSNFMFWLSTGSGYLIEGHEYMAHRSANIDEKVWLTKDDVAQGIDTVVEMAIKWIMEFTDIYDPAPQFPDIFQLSQNYPNPFNSSTRISYKITKQTKLVLKIYDVLGREIKTLVNENQMAGLKSVIWDGTDSSGRSVSSGVYIYKIQTNDLNKEVLYRKMLLLQ